MRTLTNSAMTIQYPDDFVFSGDLNLLQVKKNTTATVVEMSFVIDGYTYKENLFFHGSTVTVSLTEIFNLLYGRTENTTFPTAKSFEIEYKLYNNSTLIDDEKLSFAKIVLGRRLVFDKLGVIKSTNYYEYCPDVGVTTFYFDWGQPAQELWYMGVDDVEYYIDLFEPSLGFYSIDISQLSPAPLYFFYSTFDETFDETFHNKIEFVNCDDCGESTDRIGLRFLNRFGLWRYYAFRKVSGSLTASAGISLDFITTNYTELSGLKTEQQKSNAQGLNIIKENVDKIIIDDLSDLLSTDNVHIYDDINSNWIPVRVQTNGIVVVEKDSLFDFPLIINLKVDE